MYSELQGADLSARMRWQIGTYVSHTVAPMHLL